MFKIAFVVIGLALLGLGVSGVSVAGFGLVALGIYCCKWSIATTEELRKYEFDNRTSGGVVQFKSYEDSVRHQGKESRSSGAFTLGFLLCVAGGIMFFTGL